MERFFVIRVPAYAAGQVGVPVFVYAKRDEVHWQACPVVREVYGSDRDQFVDQEIGV